MTRINKVSDSSDDLVVGIHVIFTIQIHVVVCAPCMALNHVKPSPMPFVIKRKQVFMIREMVDYCVILCISVLVVLFSRLI